MADNFQYTLKNDKRVFKDEDGGEMKIPYDISDLIGLVRASTGSVDSSETLLQLSSQWNQIYTYLENSGRISKQCSLFMSMYIKIVFKKELWNVMRFNVWLTGDSDQEFTVDKIFGLAGDVLATRGNILKQLDFTKKQVELFGKEDLHEDNQSDALEIITVKNAEVVEETALKLLELKQDVVEDFEELQSLKALSLDNFLKEEAKAWEEVRLDLLASEGKFRVALAELHQEAVGFGGVSHFVVSEAVMDASVVYGDEIFSMEEDEGGGIMSNSFNSFGSSVEGFGSRKSIIDSSSASGTACDKKDITEEKYKTDLSFEDESRICLEQIGDVDSLIQNKNISGDYCKTWLKRRNENLQGDHQQKAILFPFDPGSGRGEEFL